MATGDIIVQFGLVLLVAIIGYVVLVRPQLTRMADHHALLTNLQIGDRVVTQAGLIGDIAAFDDADVVSLSVTQSMTVKIARTSIERKYSGTVTS